MSPFINCLNFQAFPCLLVFPSLNITPLRKDLCFPVQALQEVYTYGVLPPCLQPTTQENPNWGKKWHIFNIFMPSFPASCNLNGCKWAEGGSHAACRVSNEHRSWYLHLSTPCGNQTIWKWKIGYFELNLARHGTHWDQHKEYPRTPYIPWKWNTVGFVKFSFLEKSRLKFISTTSVDFYRSKIQLNTHTLLIEEPGGP